MNKKDSSFTTLSMHTVILLFMSTTLFAQNNLTGTIGGFVRATADLDTTPTISYYANLTDENPAKVTAADIFGLAHSEGSGTLSHFTGGMSFAFSSDVYVSSSANTHPEATAAVSLSFTATTPVRFNIFANTRASSTDIGYSTAYVALSNSTTGALIFSIGANLAGVNSEEAQLDEIIQPGSYYFQAVASDYLNPSPTFPQTYGASGFGGNLNITQVPEPSTITFYGIFGVALLTGNIFYRSGARVKCDRLKSPLRLI